jgi:riboflavin kinase/FMN adenylyltransferase
VLTIGAFDGIHLGHQAMIRQLRAAAQHEGVPAALLTFEPTPREYFARGAPPGRLTRLREKVEVLRECGVDRFVCARFNEQLRLLTPEQFVEDIVVGALGARHVIVGHDFRFGRNHGGDVRLLREHGARAGFGVTEVDAVAIGEERVSSSLVRAALDQGDMQRAAQLLGLPYRMTGKVVQGARLGRKLGFPTANLRPKRRATPLAGVFAVRVSGCGLQNAPGVASLGTRPAVNGKELLLEAHVFDFAGDLYRQYLQVDFIARLRDERWFPSVDALAVQMREDAAQAREILARG